ncbi:MAG: HAD family hydrolase [Deltaproteobacteria bacterium]|nr:MAG: HAD family hydrolase [Deltaproteobacteria bacterium]
MALKDPREIRLIAFDLDGTLIDGIVYLWQTLHHHFETDAEARRLAAERYFSGQIDYRSWFETDLELLRAAGANRESIEKALGKLKPVPGAASVLGELKKRGYRLALISGSLDVALDHFFDRALFDVVFINEIDFAPDGSIAGGRATPYDLEKKALGLEHAASRFGLGPGQCAFVGDNINDTEVMKRAGFAIAVNPKSPEIEAIADVVIADGRLDRLLEIFPGPTAS